MKKNTWVIYFFVILFTAILSINLVWRLTPVKEEINNSIRERLRPYLGESFNMNDFSLGFGYISFYNVTAGGGNESYLLHLDEIQIGYSIHKLFLHKFDPLRVIETVTFKKPRLYLFTEKKDSSSQAGEDKNDAAEILKGLQRLAEIDRIFIKDGQILWGNSQETAANFVNNLEGYLFVNGEKKATVNLAGIPFGAATPDFKMTGDIDLEKRSWDINIDISNSLLRNGLPFLNSHSFSIKSAVMDGKLHASCSSFNLLDAKVGGTLQVRGMNGLLFDQKVKTNDFEIHFADQKMELSPVSGQVEEGRFVLTGNLGTIFDPGLYFSVDFDNYPAKKIAISAPILELLNQGEIQGHLDVNGPKSDIRIMGKIYSSKLYYTFVPFYRTSMEFTFANKIWTFHDIYTHSIGLDHHGTGEIDFNTMKMSMNISSERHIGTTTFHILDQLNNSEMRYHTTMEGDFPTLTFTGTVKSIFHHPADTVLTADMSYKLVKDQIVIKAEKSSPAGIEFHADVSNLWQDPTINILELKNLPFQSLSSLAAVHWLSKKFETDFYFAGPVNFPSVKAVFNSRASGSHFFTFSGNTANLIRPGLKFNGRFNFETAPEPITGKLALEDSGDHLAIKLGMPGMADGSLSVGYGNEAPFSGQLQIQNLPARQYLGKINELYKAINEGQLSGKINFSGTAAKPLIDFNIEGHNFIINQNGYYSAKFEGQYNNENLYFKQAWINYNNVPIFDAKFKWNHNTDLIDAHFQGEKIESNFLATTLFKNPNLIRGGLGYDITMKGLFQRPAVEGSIFMQNGVFGERGFSHLNIVFKDSIPSASTLFDLGSHVFKISRFSYVDQKDYTVEAYGRMPVDANAPMDIDLTVSQNILAEIPSLLDYFQNPDCLGDLQLHITGSRGNPKLSAGHLKIYNGSMQFASVIPPLKELKADIELKEGESFIHINDLEGKIGGHFVKIYNVQNAASDSKELQPWYFEDLGLNFGVLILETESKGIPLSIPGMMNPGDIGYFATVGKTDNEKFYFSGPADRPTVRGKVTLYDSRVTFPFLPTETDSSDTEESKVIDFLWNINWDLTAIAGVGNRYFVDIPAVVGQVYMDINIDNVSKGLDFTGRLVDESFRVEGNVESTRGRVEYLDMNFRVDRFGAIFNRFELYPEVYGRAWTTVRDSTNFPKDIYLELYTIDPETKQEVSRGRWEDFRFKLVSSDPTIGESQENVLSYLGYSMDNLGNKAGNVGLTLTENYLFRPLVRPLERKLERGLRLDYVRLQSNITSNLINFGFQNRFKFLQQPNFYYQNVNNNFDPALLLLQSSEITLGKYLLKDVYLTYTGQLISLYDESKLGLNHKLGLEYRLLRNLLLEFEYDKFQINPEFYSRNALNDFKIRLRHSFNF